MEEEDTLGGRKRGHDGSASSEKPYKTIYKRDGRVVVDLTDD
jgi:hypothetical protein